MTTKNRKKQIDYEIQCLESEIQELLRHGLHLGGSTNPAIQTSETTQITNSPQREQGTQPTEHTEELPHKWKCPFSGELMRNPVEAYDSVVYEERNIEMWRRNHGLVSPITGYDVVYENLIPQNELRQEIRNYMRNHPGHQNQSQGLSSLLRDLYDLLLVQVGIRAKPLPVPPKPLKVEIASLRTIKTFHQITKNKFSDNDIDMAQLCNPSLIKQDLPDSWWPISQKQELAKAMWTACKRFRDQVQIQFLNITTTVTVEFETFAETYFLPVMMSEMPCSYYHILSKALEKFVQNFSFEDNRLKTTIERNIQHGKEHKRDLITWRTFWNELPDIPDRYN